MMGFGKLALIPPIFRFIQIHLLSTMRAIFRILTVTLLGLSSAGAASITIVNPGFESDAGLVNAGTTWSDNTPTGWLDPDNPGTNANSNFLENIGGFASDGIVHLGFDANENGIIYQDLSTAWAPNTKYTLTLGVGRRAGFGAGQALIGLASNSGTVVSNDSFSTAAFSSLVNTGNFVLSDGTFADTSLTFTTGAVAPTGNIRLFVKEVDTVSRIHVDNFRLDAVTVPEPSTLALLGACTGLLIRRRRR
jgi:hypothetical protein